MARSAKPFFQMSNTNKTLQDERFLISGVVGFFYEERVVKNRSTL
jgi:hypothetical protein